ncbi:uncharacterized protein RJT21DRAFT_15834 [Scheffersomyces amazonensis]|uniref:uncharacterized protein n=1 Tax=Scheffersomyces amazonensis TaxID=1078765 RepID=UPI00315D0EBB
MLNNPLVSMVSVPVPIPVPRPQLNSNLNSDSVPSQPIACKRKSVRFLPPSSPPPYILSSSPNVNKFHITKRDRNNYPCNRSTTNIAEDDETDNESSKDEYGNGRSVQLRLPSYKSHETIINPQEPFINKLDKLPVVDDPRLSLKVNLESLKDGMNNKYRSGEYIRGYLMLTNEDKEKPIKYKSISISFEGRYMITVNRYRAYEKVKVPVKINKFLEMFDTGNEDPEDDSNHDDTLHESRTLNCQDGASQSFQFRVPSQIIDKNNCNHYQLPPSIGEEIDDENGISFDNDNGNEDMFNDSLINYRIIIRVVSEDGESIIKELASHVTILGSKSSPEDHLCYRNYEEMIDEMKCKIESGWKTLNKPKSFNSIAKIVLPPEYVGNEFDIAKHSVLSNTATVSNKELIEVDCAIKHTTINHQKLLEDKFSYCKLSLPLTIMLSGDKMRPNKIKIKNLKVELIVANIKSDGGPIPIQFDYNMLDNETIKDNIVNPCQVFKTELYNLLVEINFLQRKIIDVENHLHQLNINVEDYNDLRSLTKLRTKFKSVPLKVINPTIITNDNGEEWFMDLKENKVKKSFTLRVDFLKALEQFELLPTFQSCYLVRMYYLKVSMTINGKSKVTKLPIIIES